MKNFSKVLSIPIALVMLLTACAGKTPETSTPTPALAVADVIAEGHVVPNQGVFLSFQAGGRVDEVLVHRGDQVSAGQVLVRLGDREPAAAALAGAQAQESAARQAFDLLVRTADLGLGQSWQVYMDAQKARAA